MCSRLRRERRRQVYTVYFNLLITACLLARTTEFRASVNIFYHHEKSTRKGADFVVELKATKTHTQIFKVNRREFYCVVELPLSDYPLYGKQLVARG